jgi:hypothetical protein
MENRLTRTGPFQIQNRPPWHGGAHRENAAKCLQEPVELGKRTNVNTHTPA